MGQDNLHPRDKVIDGRGWQKSNNYYSLTGGRLNDAELKAWSDFLHEHHLSPEVATWRGGAHNISITDPIDVQAFDERRSALEVGNALIKEALHTRAGSRFILDIAKLKSIIPDDDHTFLCASLDLHEALRKNGVPEDKIKRDKDSTLIRIDLNALSKPVRINLDQAIGYTPHAKRGGSK